MSEQEDMKFVPIGLIHSPCKTPRETPRQGRHQDEISVLEVYPRFVPGLKDIEKATYLIVLYWCHLARRDLLLTKTPHRPEHRGVFACRSPSRPNPIAFDIGELVAVERNRIVIKGLDAVDQSPLLDVKPYLSGLDCVEDARLAWFKAGNRKEVH